jgi:hypothetical protein
MLKVAIENSPAFGAEALSLVTKSSKTVGVADPTPEGDVELQVAAGIEEFPGEGYQ